MNEIAGSAAKAKILLDEFSSLIHRQIVCVREVCGTQALAGCLKLLRRIFSKK